MLISKEENNMKDYVCAVCGKEHVKLWRPYTGAEPLICAVCAEERQVPREYDECVWGEKADFYIGTPTGRKLPLDKWTINEKGEIPSHHGPGPDGTPMDMTDQLEVNLRDVPNSGFYDEMTLVPAVHNGNGIFYPYASVPEERCKWWESLPTR